MSVIKLTPKTKKPELKVNYEGTEYTLPGHISASMIEVMIKAQTKEGDDGFLRVFLATYDLLAQVNSRRKPKPYPRPWPDPNVRSKGKPQKNAREILKRARDGDLEWQKPLSPM